MKNSWFNEEFTEENLSIGARTSIKIKSVLYSGRSEYQKIEVMDTESFGRLLLLDDIIMLTEENEFSYHEMIAHIPLIAHPSPKKVLIIGGGDGGTAREVFRHSCIEQCVMVEIDEMVIEKSKEFFTTLSEVFNNKILDLKIEDAVNYLKNNENYFDIIIIDSTDPIGPAEGLYTSEFYNDVFDSLNESGIMVAQAETPYFYKEIQKDLFGKLKKQFPYVTMYLSHIPFYPSGTWSFAFASKKYKENDKPRLVDLKKIESELQYLNNELYSASFVLPNFVRKIIK